MIRLVFLWLFIILHFGVNALGQAQKVTTQQLLWLCYHPQANIGKNFTWHADINERFYVHKSLKQHQFVVRNQLYYKLGNNWSAAGGITFFNQVSPQDPENAGHTECLEVRFEQEFNNKQKLSDKFEIIHRYRIEQRFFEKMPNSDARLQGFEFKLHRYRYRLMVNYKPSTATDLTLSAYGEIHLQSGPEIVKNPFDQRRWGLQMVYGIAKNLKFELGAFNWWQQEKTGTSYTNRYITRVGLIHNLNRAKPKPETKLTE